MLDLQYSEDSRAMVDLNCVMNEQGGIIELQGTGEGRAITARAQPGPAGSARRHPAATEKSIPPQPRGEKYFTGKCTE